MTARRNLELATLRSLIAIDETGSMTAAAKRLHMTQSAISMQVKRLEESLELDVFERIARGIKPTATGEQLLQYARQIVSLNDEAWGRMTAADYQGRLVIGAPVDLINPYVPLAVRDFVRDYPRAQVKIRCSNTVELLAQMDAGELDLVLATQMQPRAGGEVLQRLPLQWVGAIEGQAWRRTPLPIAFSRTCAFRDTVVDALNRAGMEWSNAIEAGDESAISATISADLAVGAELSERAQATQSFIEHDGKLPELPSYAVVLYQRGGGGSDLQRALAGYVRRRFGDG